MLNRIKKGVAALCVVVLVVIVLSFTVSCGNYSMIDTKFSYTHAYIKVGDEWIKVEVDSWRDYSDGDQLQVVDTDGNVWLSSSNNIVLVKEADNAKATWVDKN